MPQSKAQLQPYQEYARQFVNTHPFCGVFFDMGLGKAIDDEVFIPANNRMQQVKTLLPGDILYDMDGKPCKIQAVFHHTNIEAYEVTLSDKRTFICSYDHLIPLCESELCRNPINPTPLSKILALPFKHQDGKKHRSVYKNAIPRARSIQFATRPHNIPANIMGLILHYGRIQDDDLRFDLNVKNPDEQKWALRELERVADFYDTRLEKYHDDNFRWYYQFRNLTITETLLDYLDYLSLNPKLDHIPDEYKFDSETNRAELLTNLLALGTPGTDTYHLEAKFETGRRQLAHDIASVVRSLGFECIQLKPKKANHVKYHIKTHTSETDRVYITRIRQVASRNMTCFTVDSPSHTYVINDFIATHNTLITLQSIMDRNPNGHILVIAPKNIARNTWIDEINKFGFPIRHKSLICDENFKDLSRKKRLQRYEEVQTDPATLYFINRELLTDLIKRMPVINGQKTWFFPNIIIDESQGFKSYKSERFKAIKFIRPCLQSLTILTGTPTPKDLMDLWAQIYMLDMGVRLGPNITTYRRTFFRETLYVNGHPVKWEPLPGAEEEIYRRIGDIVISAKNTQLPPITFNDFMCYMDDDEWQLYKKFAKESVIDINNTTQVEAANRGVLHNKLAQMASGTIYIDDQQHYEIIHKHKIEAVKQIIAASSGPIMIAYWYNSDKDILLQELPDAVRFDGSNKMLKDWNAGKIPIMLLHPASAGHGLNFQYGGHILIWYTIIDNLEYYLQTNARLRRPGQIHPVIVHHIMMDKTVDVSGVPALNAKEDRERRLLDAVQMAVDYVFEQENPVQTDVNQIFKEQKENAQT